MELGLRLGDAPPFGFAQKPREPPVSRRGLDFCLGFSSIRRLQDHHDGEEEEEETQNQKRKEVDGNGNAVDGRFCAAMDDGPSSLQLDLLPRTPVVSRRSSETDVSEAAGFTDVISAAAAAAAPPSAATAEGGGESPRHAVLEFCKYGGGAAVAAGGRLFQPENNISGGGFELEEGISERGCWRGSDEEDQNMGSKKKLRLSREQSAFLEESFKEHHTLYPKQKLELARRLNLRPRQVEVWFQNRRARTKLKQTEVDCEYLKKCCETLTQENRKLQKELQDLRALKTTDSLFMHLPATTLTMCTSCERAAAAATAAKDPMSKASGFSFTRPGSYPFARTEPRPENK